MRDDMNRVRSCLSSFAATSFTLGSPPQGEYMALQPEDEHEHDSNPPTCCGLPLELVRFFLPSDWLIVMRACSTSKMQARPQEMASLASAIIRPRSDSRASLSLSCSAFGVMMDRHSIALCTVGAAFVLRFRVRNSEETEPRTSAYLNWTLGVR